MSPALSVPEGYKMTEVGIIPGDWDVTTVGDEFNIQLGKMLDEEKNTGIYKPFLGNRSVQWNYIDINGIGEIKLTSTDIQKFRLRRGDLLVCEGGEVGRSAIWKDDLEECYFQKALHRLRPKKAYSVPLMGHLLQWLADTGGLQNFVTQTSIAHLPKDKFETVPIPLPEEAEQQAIAETLSDADALVESLEQLLTKKRQIKQGAMQELLTGQKRLPGFSGEWAVKTFGELFHFSGGFTASRDQLSANGYCYLHYGDIHTSSKTYIDVRAEYQEIPKLDIALKKITPTSLLEDGDVVFVDASEDDDGTSKYVVVSNPDGIPFISGLHTIVAKSKTGELANLYKRHCFQTLSIKTQFRFFAVGTKVSGISKSNIAKIVVPVPSIEEQTAIAAILSDLDSDIAALQSQLAKARQIKQGMMQELLTGRIRLVSPAITQGVPA